MIGFDPYSTYVLLYVTMAYGKIYVFTNLGNWSEDFVQILVFVLFLVAH